MTPSPPDIRQHVARRVRITRMFFRLSLEEASSFLGIPVWLLYYKESGLVHFSYQEFVDMDHLYKIPWLTFFQDYIEAEKSKEQNAIPDKSRISSSDSTEKLDAIVKYLTLGAAELTAMNSQQGEIDFKLSESSYNQREPLASARRWA